MKQVFSRVSLFGLAAVLAAPSLAQEAPEIGDGKTIVVTGERLRGEVETEVPPVVELDEADIAAVGAGSIEELVEQLGPQTGSGRGRGGRPVFLVNGQRVSSFREFHRYPPEAIVKVEVFPEEVALQYGYPADQRVINFILKENFTSREIEAEYRVPSAGGRAAGEIEVAQLTINGPNRLSLAADYNTSSMLTEAERGIIQTPESQPTVPGDPDPANFRSLASDAEALEVEGAWHTGFGEGAKAATLSLSASHERAFTHSLSGLDTVLLTLGDESALRTLDTDPLTRRGKVTTTALASSFNKPLGDWILAVTADGNLTQAISETDRRRDGDNLQALVDAGVLEIDAPLPQVPSAGFDRARSETYTLDTLATLRGNPILLPSGEIGVTVDAGYKLNGIDSVDTRGSEGETSLDRRRANAGINLAIPLASARKGFLAPLGEVGVTFGGGIDRLSDFGTLTDWNAGLNWRPSESLSLQASYTVREVAPSLTQLGDVQIVAFNVPVFDFTLGETALVAVTSGGNPSLLAETQRDIKLSANYDFDLFQRANLRIEYFRNRSDNVTEGFPLLTPEIEAAFPDRATRDADGRLTAIDRRPITFATRNSSRVRYGFNVFGRVGKEQPKPEGEHSRTPRFGRRDDGQGRWRLSLYHTIELDNEALIAPGVPPLDLLDGDALGGGGVSRHRLELEGGVFHKGLGARFSGNYSSATRVDDLRFGDLAKFDVRLFANLEEQEWLAGGAPGFFKGVRVSMRIDNIFGARQRVTDETGEVPLSYQPGLIDPLSRTIELEVRKVF